MSDTDFVFGSKLGGRQFRRDPEAERLVEDYIARVGVTMCPTAFVTATLNAQPNPATIIKTMEPKVPRSTIRKRTAFQNKQDSFWTPALCHDIKQQREEKVSFAAIGKKIGRSASSVCNALIRYNNNLFSWQQTQ